MGSGVRIGVVIPVYNEVEFVGEVIDTLPSVVDRAYVVDDCSTDGSWEVIRRRRTARHPAAATQADGGQSPPTVIPMRHETNGGRGAAVKTGYRAALEDDLDVVVVMDGDGQMDPDRLDSLVEPVADGVADYAKGDRLSSVRHRAPMSTWRSFGNWVLSVLTRIASGYWRVSDSQNGYTAISVSMLEQLDIDALYDGYGFLNDMLVRLNAHDARVVEVPMPAIYGDEESGIEYQSFVPTLSLLIGQLFIWRLATKYLAGQTHTVGVLYGLGIGVGAFGLGYAAHWAPLLGDVGRTQLGIAIFGLSGTVLLAAVALERSRNRHLVTKRDRS